MEGTKESAVIFFSGKEGGRREGFKEKETLSGFGRKVTPDRIG